MELFLTGFLKIPDVTRQPKQSALHQSVFVPSQYSTAARMLKVHRQLEDDSAANLFPRHQKK